MLIRILLPFIAIAASLATYGQALAVDVCWADYKNRCPSPWYAAGPPPSADPLPDAGVKPRRIPTISGATTRR